MIHFFNFRQKLGRNTDIKIEDLNGSNLDIIDKSHAMIVKNEMLKVYESTLIHHFKIFDIIPESLGMHIFAFIFLHLIIDY